MLRFAPNDKAHKDCGGCKFVASRYWKESNGGGNTTVSAELRRALCFFKNRVVNGPSIEICAAVGEVIHVFTDEAFEEGLQHPGTVGGVVYSSSGMPSGFFSEVVPQRPMDRYLETSRNLIYLVELLGALVAILLWAQTFPHRYV